MIPDPRKSQCFRFLGRQFDPATGEARLTWSFDEGPVLTETITFPWAPWPSDASRQAAFFHALDLLHLVAGISYFKAGLPPSMDMGDLPMDAQLAAFAERLYRHGLAEFAHRNGLELDGRIHFPAGEDRAAIAEGPELPERALVAMGGGKDSLVSLDALQRGGIEVQPFCVGAAPLIGDTVRAAGLPLIRIERQLAPELSAMNEAGAWNGHVPVTAINAAIGLCAALLYGFRWVVFSNERSADEPTLHDEQGRAINHQYSKSFDYELDWLATVRRQVGPGVEVFSLLRPYRELAIARRFSELTDFHSVFSSCNRNFHLDGSRTQGRWCGDCPKCRFTTLALAPFMPREAVTQIVGADLLDDPAQAEGFRALLGLASAKPFECVGTIAECRAALCALTSREDWKHAALVGQLADALDPDPEATLEACLSPVGDDAIPPALKQHARL